jgi:uncharacterized repeat protein (TIGR03803 family)
MDSNGFFSGSRQQRFSPLILLAACVALSTMLPAQAQTYTVLYSFKGTPDGQSPTGGIVRDRRGNIFGVTYGGGVSFAGTAFKLSASGKESVLYSFLAGYGAHPDSTVVRDAKGNLYGTTEYGGAYNQGAVFKIDPKRNETVLYSFKGGAQYFGFVPNAVIRDEQGNLYGTTVLGGKGGSCFGYGCGIVFKLDPAGKETVLYNFKGGRDGGYPSGPIVRDAAGNLFGETAYGGDLRCYAPYGCGTVFKLTPSGKETVLHRFTGTGGDGAQPWSGLVRDKEGNLYGSTVDGGTGPNCTSDENGCGTVFKVDKTGKETILHSFAGSAGDGAPIYAPLALDAKGNVYGTTPNGGSQNCISGCGAIFMLDPSGKDTIVHEFTGGVDGADPQTGVIMDSAGNIYGTTGSGGDLSCGGGYGCGTIFKLSR